MRCLLLLAACLLAMGTPGCARGPRPLPTTAASGNSATAQAHPIHARKGARMTVARLSLLLRSAVGPVRGARGRWMFRYRGVMMACLAQSNADRMRIVAPITRATKITPAQRRAMLEANFHTALDARYATSGGVLYATFVHPLAALTEHQLRSALFQVANLARTFGSSYSSGVLRFGKSKPAAPKKPTRRGVF